jgi:hypothetical protein
MKDVMFGWIRDSFVFLIWLAVLFSARLAVVMLCITEAVVVVALWCVAFVKWQMLARSSWLLLPVGVTLFVTVQVALWKFTWLRLARRGGRWRAIAEYFSSVVRYPVVRTPQPWE